jgi:uncharacterized membrane protein
MDAITSEAIEPTPGSEGDRRQWLKSLLPTLVFDVVGPLVAYYGLKDAGLSNVSALVLSGILPAVRVVGGLTMHRKVDAVGLLVLIGIAIGTTVGLVSHSARLVLLEGIVPTALFGVVCLGSLATAKPLMFRLALTFMGPDTKKGQEFADMWRYEGFRHVFRVITIVWGAAYIVEAGVKAFIVESTSVSTAKAITQVLPYAVLGVVVAWNISYGKRRRSEGERLLAAAIERGEAPPSMPAPGARTRQRSPGADS